MVTGTYSGPDTQACFQDTHWSVVLTAAQADLPQAAAALETRCRAYWSPLYAFVRRRGHSPEEAQDLTQEFFWHLLRRNSLAGVRPTAGKFCSFLLVCLKNFLAKERGHARAQRRGGGCVLLPLDLGDGEIRHLLEPAALLMYV